MKTLAARFLRLAVRCAVALPLYASIGCGELAPDEPVDAYTDSGGATGDAAGATLDASPEEERDGQEVDAGTRGATDGSSDGTGATGETGDAGAPTDGAMEASSQVDADSGSSDAATDGAEPNQEAGVSPSCTDVECGELEACEIHDGDAQCRCLDGYERISGTCVDVDECAAGTDDCDDDPDVCVNAPGGFSCGPCPTGFAGNGIGAGGCAPTLEDLTVELGTLSPSFSPTRENYTVSLGYLDPTLSFTATAPESHTLARAGAPIASGQSQEVGLFSLDSPVVVGLEVSAGGAQREYAIEARRGIGRLLENEPGPDATPGFGSTLAMSNDGRTLAVGSPLEADEAGAVYVYIRGGDQWTVLGALAPDSYSEGDQHGFGLAVSGDGNTVVVGSQRSVGGGVYVYERSGNAFGDGVFIQHPNTEASIEDDDFGSAIALSEDGSVLVVGARHEDGCETGIGAPIVLGGCERSGAVFVYRRSEVWGVPTYIKASDSEAGLRFGQSASLSADGTRLVVGAPGYDSNDGAVYHFSWNGSSWSEQGKVLPSSDLPGANFGFGTAMNASGSVLAVAATRYGPGEVLMYSRAGTTWAQTSSLPACDDGELYFGQGLSMSRNGGVVAAETSGGRTCVYTGSGNSWTRTLGLRNVGDTPTFSEDGSYLVLRGADGVTVYR